MKRFITPVITYMLVLGHSLATAQGVGTGFDGTLLPGPQMDYTQTIDTGDYMIESDYWWTPNIFYGHKNADSSYDGFTYSNVQDSVTPGIPNAAFPATGANGTPQYGVGHGTSGMHVEMLPGVKPTVEAYVFDMYITNATCAVLSMEQGDSTAKKFGGPNGTDPDWLLLTIKGYNYELGTVDSVLFYLADFRSDTPAMDYIVKDWTRVDLTSLGRVDSLSFSLSSSDTGAHGMRTPAYFCIDEIYVENGGGIDEKSRKNKWALYPNPVGESKRLYLEVQDETAAGAYTIYGYDLSGKTVLRRVIRPGSPVDASLLPPGTYFFTLFNAKQQTLGTQTISIR